MKRTLRYLANYLRSSEFSFAIVVALVVYFCFGLTARDGYQVWLGMAIIFSARELLKD